MGFIGSMFDQTKGAGFQAGQAPIQTPTTVGQANTAYDQTQQGLQQQQAFLQALQGQNGIQNQSNVFNQQQGLANQLQGVASGTGPNPALAQLNQTTGQNTANQAALMAGQRGASSNPGLIARQAAMQGGANQQNAVGQGATLAAQQQLAGMNALAGQQAQLANTAGTQVGQQSGALNNYNQFAQGQQANLLNSIGQQNNAQVGMQSNINSANAGIAGINAQGGQGLLGGVLGGAGSALGLKLAKGGEVSGGVGESGAVKGPMSNAGKYFQGFDNMGSSANATNPMLRGGQTLGNALGNAIGSGIKSLAPSSADVSPFKAGGKVVPAIVSPGEKYLNPSEAQAVARGKVSPAKVGEVIPGQAKVKGDSYTNDTVPKELEEGGCVIPRSKMGSEKSAMAFVRAHMSSHGLGKGKKK